jgi:hypothetical protein
LCGPQRARTLLSLRVVHLCHTLLDFIYLNLVITHIFYAHKFQGKKPNLSREFHEFSRIGFYNPCELAKFAAKCSGFGALNDGYGLVGNHQI